MTKILNGKEVAKSLLISIRQKVEQSSLRPGLAVIQVGSNPASSIYVQRKGSRARKLGFYSTVIPLPESCS